MEEHNKDIEVSKTDEEIKETEKAEAEEPKVDEKPVNEQSQENPEKEPEKETVQKEEPEKQTVQKEEEPQPEVKTQAKKSQKKCPAWLKTTGKVIGVMALVGCASFGGTYAAITVLEERMSGFLNDQLNDFYDDFDDGFDYSFGNGGNSGGGIFGDGGSSSSKKTNDNSAGLGVYIYNDSDVAQISAFTDDSLADDAGLQVGDIIISIDGEDTDDYDEVVEKLKDHQPGDTVRVGYERNGVKGEVKVELIDRTSSSSDFPSGNGNRYMQ